MPITPMQPPSRQPIGFWTTRAGEAVAARTRGALADVGVSQPQWWVLHQLSLHPDGMDRAAMIETIGPNDTTRVIEDALLSTSARAWTVDDGTRLAVTELGTAMFQRAARVQDDLQAERMQGISEADFVTTIEVLQRIISNVGGDAWHW